MESSFSDIILSGKKPEEILRVNLHFGNFSKLPEELWEYENIEFLELSENNLTSLPDNFAVFKNLKTISLHKNNLVELFDGFSNLKNLEHLDLGGNFNLDIQKVTKQIAKLPKLKELVLSHCSLRSVDQSLFKIEHLKILYLNSNKITDLPVFDLDNDFFSKFQKIDLSVNDFLPEKKIELRDKLGKAEQLFV